MRIFGKENSSSFVRIFGKGKCKLIANFIVTLVTSLPSVSVSLSLSLSSSTPHAQYRKRFRASYNPDRYPDKKISGSYQSDISDEKWAKRSVSVNDLTGYF